MNQTNAKTPFSASVVAKPRDARCHYWALVIRAGRPLPAPEAVTGARDIVSAVNVGYLKAGSDVELFEGDFLIEGEANHHKRNEGYTYWITWPIAEDATEQIAPTSETKAALKTQGLPKPLLLGSGQLAACIRVAHALRAGLNVPT